MTIYQVDETVARLRVEARTTAPSAASARVTVPLSLQHVRARCGPAHPCPRAEQVRVLWTRVRMLWKHARVVAEQRCTPTESRAGRTELRSDSAEDGIADTEHRRALTAGRSECRTGRSCRKDSGKPGKEDSHDPSPDTPADRARTTRNIRLSISGSFRVKHPGGRPAGGKAERTNR